MRMRNALLTLCALLLFAACDKAPQYTISGNTGACNSTLYLFGLDSRYDRIETIKSDAEGAFSHTIKTDTILPLGLALPSGHIIALYAEPGVDASLFADSIKGSGWLVKGGKEQQKHDSICRILAGAKSNSDRLVHIDKFTKAHPYSITNVDVIRRFLVDKPAPNNSHAAKRIANLGGTVQDHEFFTGIKEKIEQKNSNTHNKLLPTHTFTDANGKRIGTKEYKEKMLIVNFWAAWDSASVAGLKEVQEIIAQSDTTFIKTLNISLDYDTEIWRAAIKKHGIKGDNVCDREMWENAIAKKFSISGLPYTLIVSPYQRVEVYNPARHELLHKTDSLVEKYSKSKKEKERFTKSKNIKTNAR